MNRLNRSASTEFDAVVAATNDETTIVRCLKSLEPCAKRILVMGPSCDGTLDAARLAGRIDCFQDNRRGFFAAYDMGWRRASASFVVFLDADAYLHNSGSFLMALRSKFEDNVGIVVATHSAVVSNKLSMVVASWWQHRRDTVAALERGPPFSAWQRFYFRFFFSTELHSGAVVTGPCYAIRREMLEKIGGLPWDGDDFVLGRLAEQAGYKVVFFATKDVMHYPRTTVNGLLRQYLTYGLHYSPNARRFFTLKERIFGLFNYPLSFGVGLLCVRIFPTPEQVIILPLARLVQLFGSILGFIFKNAKDVKVRRGEKRRS